MAEIQRQLATEFVVFATGTLELDRLGEPVEAPVTVGSRPSPATMASDAPAVVSVEPDGRLLPRQPGEARISARNGGPALRVQVRVPTAAIVAAPATATIPGPLSIRPASARLRLGEIQAFEALTPSGPVAGEWSTSDDRKVAYLQDQLFQGTEPGRAQICARAAGLRACSTVEVTQ